MQDGSQPIQWLKRAQDEQRQRRAKQLPNGQHCIPLSHMRFLMFDQTSIILVFRHYFDERALSSAAESIGEFVGMLNQVVLYLITSLFSRVKGAILSIISFKIFPYRH